ncbi:MAG: hypothetical protein ACYTEQ_05750 [Planctomycetota bacterium]|jgi:hypothetical protein
MNTETIEIINWCVAAIAAAGAVLNVKHRWQGFVFWLVSNSWWLLYNVCRQEYAAAALFALFLGLSAYGIISWRKDIRTR